MKGFGFNESKSEKAFISPLKMGYKVDQQSDIFHGLICCKEN